LQAARARIEAEVSKELAKLSDRADKLEREKARMQALERAFAEIAARESDCPSKAEGGNLGWFPRAGAMVEPFARAAFALKPYQLSEPVTTEFGLHLILAIDHKPGKDIKFEDVRSVVREVYYDRLRESLISQLRPRARIDIQQAAKQ
jgi:parvulin-like peptidyl-prolyl isomerase